MTSPRTIVVVSDFAYVNGGQAKVAIDSAKGLAEAGLDVIFFAACGPVDESLGQAGVKVVCLGQNDILQEPDRIKAAIRGLWNFSAAKALRSLLESLDPASTVVHCHGFAKALSPSIGPVITGGPWAHVYTCHEYFLACPNGGFYDYQKNQICTRRALGPACLATNCDVRHPAHKAWRVARQATLWSAGAMPRALKHVIYISETQRKVLAPYFGPQTTLHYVPNPVGPQPIERVRAEDNDIFLFIGRLNPEKGAVLFASASKMAGVRSVFVGDGPERTRVQNENGQAKITGWVSPDEVTAWLRRARTVIFPSLWYECAPLAVYEALAYGIPVVCGDWTAASDLVEDGVNGRLLLDASIQTLALALTSQRDTEIVRNQSLRAFGHKPTSVAEHVTELRNAYAASMAAEMLRS